ncbi:MAG: hypothetical protein QCH35_09650 [Methanomicrobiaceae archaeon]|nr:hypothetical protein [Methanomicrobiaceae archaeon]
MFEPPERPEHRRAVPSGIADATMAPHVPPGLHRSDRQTAGIPSSPRRESR